jgi:hypothetical protein
VIPGRLAGAHRLRYALPLTNTEADEAIAAAHDAYPEPADRPNIEDEGAWWDGWKDRTDLGTEPGWGPDAEARLRDVLRNAVEDVERRKCGRKTVEGVLADRYWLTDKGMAATEEHARKVRERRAEQ